MVGGVLLLPHLKAEDIGVKIRKADFPGEDGQRHHEWIIFLTQPSNDVPNDLIIAYGGQRISIARHLVEELRRRHVLLLRLRLLRAKLAHASPVLSSEHGTKGGPNGRRKSCSRHLGEHLLRHGGQERTGTARSILRQDSYSGLRTKWVASPVPSTVVFGGAGTDPSRYFFKDPAIAGFHIISRKQWGNKSALEGPKTSTENKLQQLCFGLAFADRRKKGITMAYISWRIPEGSLQACCARLPPKFH